MITVLAEYGGNYDVIELPAQDGRLRQMCKTVKAESPEDVRVRYAGTGKQWYIDVLLLENNLESVRPDINEINLLSYLTARMDESQMALFCDRLSGMTNDLGTAGIESIINEAYEIFKPESECWYDGRNLKDLISAERERLAPYTTMNKDIFWEMIDSAKEKCGNDYKAMERTLTECLSLMKPQDIITYKQINDEYLHLADTEGIFNVGCEKNGGLGDDGFLDFRAWLIGQGKEAYMNAMRSPETVAELDAKPKDNYFLWETFNYIAADAYEISVGQDIYKQNLNISEEMRKEIESEIEFAPENMNKHESELSLIMRGGI